MTTMCYSRVTLVLVLLLLNTFVPQLQGNRRNLIEEHVASTLVYRCLDATNATRIVDGANRNIAIAFFGMSRNMPLLIRTFQKRVFDVLDRANIPYDIFWYTAISADQLLHLRQDESVTNDSADIFPVSSLPAVCRYSLVDQENIRSHEFDIYLQRRHASRNDSRFDPWDDEFNSMRNVLTAYYTQRKVLEMIRAHSTAADIAYAGILAIRPDTAMIKDIDLPDKLFPSNSTTNMSSSNNINYYYNSSSGNHSNSSVHVHQLSVAEKELKRSIWVPDFQHWFGFNDRAAFGSVLAMSQYLRRGVEYRDSENYVGGGEKFLRIFATEHNLYIKRSDMRMLRVRGNGQIIPRDLNIKDMNLSADDADFKNCVDVATQMFKPEEC